MGNINNSAEGKVIFNGEYNILQQIGVGKTANVYLAESIKNPT